MLSGLSSNVHEHDERRECREREREMNKLNGVKLCPLRETMIVVDLERESGAERAEGRCVSRVLNFMY